MCRGRALSDSRASAHGAGPAGGTHGWRHFRRERRRATGDPDQTSYGPADVTHRPANSERRGDLIMSMKTSPPQTEDTAVEHPRSVRSFVMRAGRITQAQQRALESLWPRYGVAFEPALLNFDVTFA